MVGRLRTSITVIANVTVVEGIARVESIMLSDWGIFTQMVDLTTTHSLVYVPWLTRMIAKRLTRIARGVARDVMGRVSRVLTRLAGIAKRLTLMRVIVDNFMLRFP
jgi:hypothetical protein